MLANKEATENEAQLSNLKHFWSSLVVDFFIVENIN